MQASGGLLMGLTGKRTLNSPGECFPRLAGAGLLNQGAIIKNRLKNLTIEDSLEQLDLSSSTSLAAGFLNVSRETSLADTKTTKDLI